MKRKNLFELIMAAVLVCLFFSGLNQCYGQYLGAAPNSSGEHRCWACSGRGRTPDGAICYSCGGRGYNVYTSGQGLKYGADGGVRSSYNNSYGGQSNPGIQSCFIATAAYGTPWEKNVLILRCFRERWLMTNSTGRWFVSIYYTYSPPIADMIQDYAWARYMTRIVLTPIVILAGATLGNIGDIFLVILVSFMILFWFQRNRIRGNIRKRLMAFVHKSLISIIVVSFFVCLFDVHSREGDPDAIGKITSVKNEFAQIRVKGNTQKGPLWLGCTFFPGTLKERDLQAVRKNVRGKDCLFFCSGDFDETFTVPNWIMGMAKGENQAEYVVALWRYYVPKNECNKGNNNGPCQYCLKNGYHLEDRVDIGRGTWSLETEGMSRNQLQKGQREVVQGELRDRIEREKEEKTRSEAERESRIQRLPQWLKQLAINPILSGEGLSGVQIGQSSDEIIKMLGEPVGGIYAVRSASGEVLQYAISYKSDGIFLGIYLTTDSRRVKSFRIYDENFNNTGILPKLTNGITIGSTKSELLRAMGTPKSTNSHMTGPENLGDRRASNFRYPGIEFCVPEANGKVYSIDIP